MRVRERGAGGGDDLKGLWERKSGRKRRKRTPHQELLRNQLHDELLWPLVRVPVQTQASVSKTNKQTNTYRLRHTHTHETHRFSPWLTWTWQGSERVSLVVESMVEAFGF